MENNPYQTPSTDVSTSDTNNESLFKKAMIASCFYIAPIAGIIVALLTILAATVPKNQSPATFSQSQMTNTLQLAIGFYGFTLVFGIIGVVKITNLLNKHNYRAPWFYRINQVASSLWCLTMFPFGIIVGVPMFIKFSKKRREFF